MEGNLDLEELRAALEDKDDKEEPRVLSGFYTF